AQLRGDHRPARPPGEELVAALADEDREEAGLARGPAQEVLRARDRIAEGEVELPDEVPEDPSHVLAADLHEGQGKLEVAGHRLRLELLGGVLAEVQAERLHLDTLLLQPERHSGRVDPAGEEQSHLAFAVETARDRVFQAAPDVADRGLSILEPGVERLP